MVVGVAKLFEVTGEGLDAVGGVVCGEPGFLGLVEAFDLPLGLRVVRGAVLLLDAEGLQGFLERVQATFAAGEPGGEDHPIIGEGGGGEAVRVACGQELVQDYLAGDSGVWGAGQQVAGVVIEEVQDLDIGAIRQAPVGEIGLPGFVGLVGLEALPGRTRPFMWLVGHQAAGAEDAVDRRVRRDRECLLVKMPGDHRGTGVEPLNHQGLAQLSDSFGDLGAGGVRVAARPSGCGLQGRLPAGPVAAKELVNPAAAEPVTVGGLGGREPGFEDGLDYQFIVGHGSSSM